MTKIEKLVTYYETAVHHIFYIDIFMAIIIMETFSDMATGSLGKDNIQWPEKDVS